MYKKQVYETDAQALAAHKAEWGGFNDMPPGWHEITEMVYVREAFTFTPVKFEYRQINRDVRARKLPVMLNAHLSFMADNCGFAVVDDFWPGKLTFFKFGCDHEKSDAGPELKRRGIRLMNMEHATFCAKCGFLRIVDSSD